jgi:hypothetical protein
MGHFVLRSPMNIAHDIETTHPRRWWNLEGSTERIGGNMSGAKPLGTLRKRQMHSVAIGFTTSGFWHAPGMVRITQV